MRNILASAAFVLGIAISHGAGSAYADGKIGGRVYDAIEDLPLIAARVSISRPDGFETSVLTDRNGEFEVAVFPGNYSVKINRPGYFSYERAATVVEEGGRLFLPLPLLVFELVERVDGRPCLAAPKPGYDTFDLFNTSLSKTLSIRYGKRSNVNDVSTFSNVGVSYGDCDRLIREAFQEKIRPDRFVQTMTAYAGSTIFSDSVSLTKTQIVFNGNVTYHDGTVLHQVERIELSRSDGTPKIVK